MGVALIKSLEEVVGHTWLVGYINYLLGFVWGGGISSVLNQHVDYQLAPKQQNPHSFLPFYEKLFGKNLFHIS